MEDSKEDEELVDSVDKLEKRIIQVLSKYEWRIVSFQSILVWEKPYHSAAFLGLVNFIFWCVLKYINRNKNIFSK